MEVSIYRLRTQDVLTLCVLSLLLLGVVMVQSASAGAAMRTDWQWSASGVKDAIFAAAGLATFFLVGTFNYAWLGRIPSSRWKSPDPLDSGAHGAGESAGAGSAYRAFR